MRSLWPSFASASHRIPAVVLLGEPRVVRAAEQADVVGLVASAHAERVPVVVLQRIVLGAAST
jgi:hypothetical protein